MANKPLQSIKFPGLSDKYIVPQIDDTLSVEGQAADAKETGDKITLTNNVIDSISDVREIQHSGKINATIKNDTVNSASYARVAYYTLSDEKFISITKTPGKNFSIGFATVTPANGVALSNCIYKPTASAIKTPVPSGSKFLAVYYYNSNTDTGDAETMFASIAVIAHCGAQDNVARVGISGMEAKNNASWLDVALRKNSGNLFDGVLSGGYIQQNGTLITGGTYKHTNKIDVHDLVGETIYLYNDGAQKYIRFVCIYDKNENVKSALGTNDNSLTFTIPVGAYYAVFSFAGSSVNTPYILLTPDSTKSIYVPRRDKLVINGYDAVDSAVNIPTPVELRASTLATGESIHGKVNSVKRLGTYVFYCKPGTMAEDMFIIFGKDTSKGYAVGISATKWAWFVNDVNQGGGDHNLTIKDYLLVVVNKVPGTGAVLTIYTNGGTYTRTNTSWLDDHGAPYVNNASGDTITDVKMTWTSSAFRNRNWVFGDSYVTIATPRWPKYVYDLGFGENLMINGYPGEQSEAGYKDLLDCIKRGKPSTMAWCLGMNDGDNGAVNTSWLKYVNAFLSICDIYGITPILATIPCCPLADHRYKNAWVKTSGYRYIDFASAVNVSENSTTWYEGMLSDDNIHPTAQGAIALASQVLTDFPELLVN